MTFADWVNGLIQQRFGTATALAKEIGMQVSPFTRGVAAGTLNVVNLLKLSRVSGAHPSEVLRMADKGDVAELLAELYGAANGTVSKADAELLRRFKSIPPGARQSIEGLMKQLEKLGPEEPVETQAKRRKKE